MKPKYYTIGTDNGSKQTFAFPQDAINAMNANPTQQLEDLFGYDEDGDEIIEGEVDINENGEFYLVDVSYL